MAVITVPSGNRFSLDLPRSLKSGVLLSVIVRSSLIGSSLHSQVVKAKDQSNSQTMGHSSGQH
jgi:hypothetical protein